MPRDPEPARRSLIAAGERLFAVRGVNAVSMREINKAAGQRNSSALHYHFGSKEGLLRAILAPHLERIRARRVELISKFDVGEGRSDVWSTARALVEPVTLPLGHGKSGRAFSQIIAQVLSDSSHTTADLADLFGGTALDEVQTLLAPYCAALPKEIADERLTLLVQQVVHTVADRARREDRRRSGWPVVPRELFVPNLIDMFVCALLGPVSPTTMDALNTPSTRR